MIEPDICDIFCVTYSFCAKNVHASVIVFFNKHNGKHGLSLANEAWATCCGKGEYTYEPTRAFTNAALAGEIDLSDEVKMELIENEHFGTGVAKRNEVPVPEVQKWPELADAFLKTYF